jgi:MSHA biogenesis protein MshL
MSVALVLAAVPALVLSAQQTQPLQSFAVTQLEGAPAAGQVAIPGPVAPQPGTAPGPVLPGALTGQQQPPLTSAPVLQIDARQTHPVLDGPRLSLTFDEARPVIEIFRLLFNGTGMSFVPTGLIEQTFVGELNNVTVREALDLITEATGLDYSVQGNVVRLFVRELETRLYSIDRVITQRGGSRSMSASSGAGGSSGGGGGGGATGGAAGGGGGGGGAGGGASGGGGSSSSVGGNDAPDLFGELVDGVETLLAGDEGATVMLNRTAAVLQVTARQSRLERVEQYLEAVLSRALRQIQVEARVIEVTLNEDFSAGVNWEMVLNNVTNAVRVSQTAAPATSGGFTFGLQIGDFTALLNAFATQGNVRVLSSPRVTMMNNEPAVMRIGQQRVFFTTTQQTNETGQLLQTSATPQTITEGVVLSVTAQISADNIINMSLNPSVTEFAGTATSRFGDVVPVLNVREADTLVRVREGETIVFAGLMQDKTTNSQGKVPLLGDLPFVGGAFRSTTTTRIKTDLIILLTPTLMSPAQVPGVTASELRRLDTAQKASERR